MTYSRQHQTVSLANYLWNATQEIAAGGIEYGQAFYSWFDELVKTIHPDIAMYDEFYEETNIKDNLKTYSQEADSADNGISSVEYQGESESEHDVFSEAGYDAAESDFEEEYDASQNTGRYVRYEDELREDITSEFGEDTVSVLTASEPEDEAIIKKREREVQLQKIKEQSNILHEKKNILVSEIEVNNAALERALQMKQQNDRDILQCREQLQSLDTKISEYNKELDSKTKYYNEYSDTVVAAQEDYKQITNSSPSFFIRLVNALLTFFGFINKAKIDTEQKRIKLENAVLNAKELATEIDMLSEQLAVTSQEQHRLLERKGELEIDRIHQSDTSPILLKQQQLEAELAQIQSELANLEAQQEEIHRQENNTVRAVVRSAIPARRRFYSPEESDDSDSDEYSDSDIDSLSKATTTSSSNIANMPSLTVELLLTPNAYKGRSNILYVEFTEKKIIFSYNNIKNSAFLRTDLASLLNGASLPQDPKNLGRNMSASAALLESNKQFFQQHSERIVAHISALDQQKKEQVQREKANKKAVVDHSILEAQLAQKTLFSNLSKSTFPLAPNIRAAVGASNPSRLSPSSIVNVPSDASIDSSIVNVPSDASIDSSNVKQNMRQATNKRLAIDIENGGCVLFNLSKETGFSDSNCQLLADKMSSPIAILLVGDRLFSATKVLGGKIKTEELTNLESENYFSELKKHIRDIEPKTMQVVDKNMPKLLSLVIVSLTGINILTKASSKNLAGLSEKEKEEAITVLLNNDKIKQLRGILIKCKSQKLLHTDIRIIDFPAEAEDAEVKAEREERALEQDLRTRLNSLYNEIRNTDKPEVKDLYMKLTEAGYSDLGVNANEKIDAPNSSVQESARKPLPFLAGINKKEPVEETRVEEKAVTQRLPRPKSFLDEINKGRKNPGEESPSSNPENKM